MRSGVLTDDDMENIASHVNGRIPYIWDNTWGNASVAVPISVHGHQDTPGSIFKPFKTIYPKTYIDNIAYHNTPISGKRYTVRARIVAISILDFFWNPEAYNPEESLRKALLSYVGPGMDELLIRFGELYDEVSKELTAVNTSVAGRVILEDDFEGERDWSLKSKDLPFRWHGDAPHTQKSKGYLPVQLASRGDGSEEQCIVSTSDKKGYILRTSDAAMSIPFEKLSSAVVEFDWKTDDPVVRLSIYLMANKENRIYFKKTLQAENTQWNHYSIPLSDFDAHEKYDAITEVSGIRFFQASDSDKETTFGIDNFKLIDSLGGDAKEHERVHAFEKFNECLEEIRKECFNQKLVDDLFTVYEKQAKWLKRVEAPKKTIKVKRASASPVLDGKLDDSCWVGAEKTGHFTEWRKGEDPITDTYAKLSYDDQNLYVAFFCKADQWDKDEDLVSGRDSGIFVNDCIEIFLTPDLQKNQTYYHLAANRIGSKLDQKREGSKGDRSWDPDWQIRTSRSPSSWTAEIAIPFASMDVQKPTRNTTWGLNLCREYKPGKELGSWSCTYGKFHNYLLFGNLLFE